MRDHHKNQLLDALMYYLPMDVRRKVSAEVPVAYTAYCARRRDGDAPKRLDANGVLRYGDGVEVSLGGREVFPAS